VLARSYAQRLPLAVGDFALARQLVTQWHDAGEQADQNVGVEVALVRFVEEDR